MLSQLTNHQHLGVHTEMFSDRLVDLVKLGVITNSLKKMRPGKIVTSFVIGTKKCFDFLDNNPFVDMCDIAWVNSPVIIAQNPRPMAINSCIEVDITGQVVSDSIGSRIYSGELLFLRKNCKLFLLFLRLKVGFFLFHWLLMFSSMWRLCASMQHAKNVLI